MKTSFYVALDRVPAELREGLKAVAAKTRLRFEGKPSPEIVFAREGQGVRVTNEQGKLRVGYKEANDAFRALGLINAEPAKTLKTLDIREARSVEKTWVMVDVSRNAVLTVAAAKEWLTFMALAGINGLMFYAEDTYEVPGEPFFGYARGAYTQQELRELDDFAFHLGIEMIPCVQTLAHLQRVLQYGDYSKIKDTASVLLCGEDKTYEFIEKILKAAVAPFRSKRVHIGMDEAWDLGRGAFLDRNGLVKGFDVMTAHLERVLKITRSLGIKPMMWSDMFFRALSTHHGYYDTDIEVTEEIQKKIPKDVELVYWDYYGGDEEKYEKMIGKHVEMGQTPIFAPGVWTWNRFWSHYRKAENTCRPGMDVATRRGVKEVIVTIWGDDGTECDYYSCLPLLQWLSDRIFTGEFNEARTEKNLKGTLGISFADWRRGQDIDVPPFIDDPNSAANPSKTLLWETPSLGLLQPQLDGTRLNAYYAGLARELKALSGKPGNARLRLPYLLADVLALKADLYTEVAEAYRRGDRAELARFADKVIPETTRRVKRLQTYHRKLWHANYKPFGWELLEWRYGGVAANLESFRYRLKAFLSGETPRLEELEIPRLKIFGDTPKGTFLTASFHRALSPGHFTH